MIKYKPIKERLTHPDLGTYTAYGIGVYEDRTLIRKISDISTDKRSVRKLCRLCSACTRLQLDPIHLDDIIEDILCI